MKTYLQTCILAMLLGVLSACGGGGDGGDKVPNSDVPVTLQVIKNTSITSFTPGSPNVLDTVTFSVNDLYSGITSVVWDLGDGNNPQTSTPSNGTSTVSTRYGTKGNKTVTVTSKNVSGVVLATDTLPVSVGVGTVSQRVSIIGASGGGKNIDNGGRTDSLALTLNGTYTGNTLGNDYSIRVMDGTNDLGAATKDDSKNIWIFTPSTDLSFASHTFTAVVVRNSDSLKGKASQAYIVKLGNGLNVNNNSPTVLDKITLSINNIWSTVVSMVWNFGTDAGAGKTSALVNGVFEPVSATFRKAAEYVVTVVFKGAGGVELDANSVTIKVSTGQVSETATIESVWDRSRSVEAGGEVITGQPVLKGKLSAELTDSSLYYVVIKDGDAVLAGKATTNGRDWTYTPPDALSDGTHKLLAVVSRFDGVLGAPSAARTVVVSSMAPSVTPKNTVMSALEFNTYAGSDNQSDTTGTLPGAVLFAQSQIFPATVRMANDVQPNMTSLRDALVLFKPFASANLLNGKGIMLKAYKADGSLLDTLTMEHPNDIPKTPRFLNNVDLASIQFDLNPTNPKVISAQADLTKLKDASGLYLKSLLQTNDSILIKLDYGMWVSDIYLPNGSYQGKRILVRTVSSDSTVHYTDERGFDQTQIVTKGVDQAFSAIATGRWVNQLDIDHSRYVYGKNFWTAKLPKEWILPGLKLEFIQGDKKGSLNFAAQGTKELKIGAPTELLINVIDLGMLIAPRDTFEFAKDDSLPAEYFQTIPASRFIVNRYESLQLDKVVMPNGNVFTPANPDPSKGGWQAGDMRESIAKLLVSHGIDNANYGISSSSSRDEGWDKNGHPYWAAQLTAHTSRGQYTNGTYVHGGSGGAGMVTLENTVGNEWSHEVGHNYGLEHGSGVARGVLGAIHRPSTDVNSTWAWDSKRNVFIPNFVQKPTYQTVSPPQSYEKTCKYTYQIGELSNALPSECVNPFEIDKTTAFSTAFSFGRDAMSHGIPNGAPYWKQINRFTIYSPDSASKIQTFLESKVVFDKTSSTGFRKWNPSTLKMEEIELRAPYYSSINADVTSTSSIGTVTLYTAYLQRLFTDGAYLVVVKMGDGAWYSFATAPSAVNNKDKWLTINHVANSTTTWTINGQAVVFKTGNKQTYQSDGTQWVPVANLDGTAARKPELFGIPVTTILGYYDPQNAQPTSAQPGWPGYIYPALHGAYGFVYPSESTVRRTEGCWIEVTTTKPAEAVRRYKLGTITYNTGYMNKFQVNVPESEVAKSAEVFCGGTRLTTRSDLAPAKNPLTYTVNGMPLP